MANPDIRMVAFYFNDEKAATVHQVDYQINPARTAAFGQEGYYGHAKGAVQCQFTVNEVTPVVQSSFSKLLKVIIAQKNVKAKVLIAGQSHTVDCAVTSLNFKSQSENGMTDGTMTLSGGVPDVFG